MAPPESAPGHPTRVIETPRPIDSHCIRDAAQRTRQAGDLAGIRAMLVHAISPEAARIYRYFGFQPSPGNETPLMMTLAGLEQALR